MGKNTILTAGEVRFTLGHINPGSFEIYQDMVETGNEQQYPCITLLTPENVRCDMIFEYDNADITMALLAPVKEVHAVFGCPESLNLDQLAETRLEELQKLPGYEEKLLYLDLDIISEEGKVLSTRYYNFQLVLRPLIGEDALDGLDVDGIIVELNRLRAAIAISFLINGFVYDPDRVKFQV